MLLGDEAENAGQDNAGAGGVGGRKRPRAGLLITDTPDHKQNATIMATKQERVRKRFSVQLFAAASSTTSFSSSGGPLPSIPDTPVKSRPSLNFILQLIQVSALLFACAFFCFNSDNNNNNHHVKDGQVSLHSDSVPLETRTIEMTYTATTDAEAVQVSTAKSNHRGSSSSNTVIKIAARSFH